MNLRRVHFSWRRWFASSPSTISSSVSWISPLKLSKLNAHQPDPPPATRTEARRKSKYISHNAAINLIKRERDPQHALEIFNIVSEQKGFNHNNATYATILNKLAQSKKFKAVDAVLYQMKYDTCKFHEGVCCAGKVDRARKILDFMKSKGCNPNIYNYSTLMNEFCKEVRLKEAQELLDEMKSFGIKPDTVVYTTLIDCHCRTGRVDEAKELLKEMKERRCKADTVTFNVILGGLCREGRFENALKMLDELPYEGIYLNKGSYRIVLNSLNQKGDLNKAKELLRLMMGRGFVPHYATSNELLVSLCEAGMTDDATTALFGLVEMGFKPLLDSWAFFVESICRERKLLPSFELLDELVNEEFE